MIRNNYLHHKGVQSHADLINPDRNWWIVKYNSTGKAGYVNLGKVNIPKEFVGRKLRFKVELIEEILDEKEDEIMNRKWITNKN